MEKIQQSPIISWSSNTYRQESIKHLNRRRRLENYNSNEWLHTPYSSKIQNNRLHGEIYYRKNKKIAKTKNNFHIYITQTQQVSQSEPRSNSKSDKLL